MTQSQTSSYSPDQQRVCEYIQRITNGALGCGDDPVGFLIASHAALSQDSVRAAALLRPVISAENPPVDLPMLHALLEEATPAPWYYSQNETDDDDVEFATVGPHPAPHYEETVAQFYGMNKSPMEHAANVRLVVELRNAASALLAELLRLRAPG